MSEIKQGTMYTHMGNERRKVVIVCPWCGCEHSEFISPWEIFGWGVGSRLKWCESDECEACERQFTYELGITARSSRVEVLKPDAEDVVDEGERQGVVVVEQDQEKPAETKWKDA